MTSQSIVLRVQDFIENEARSCSMDYGCITPLYIYRMWGGVVSLEKIEHGLDLLKKQGSFVG